MTNRRIYSTDWSLTRDCLEARKEGEDNYNLFYFCTRFNEIAWRWCWIKLYLVYEFCNIFFNSLDNYVIVYQYTGQANSVRWYIHQFIGVQFEMRALKVERTVVVNADTLIDYKWKRCFGSEALFSHNQGDCCQDK